MSDTLGTESVQSTGIDPIPIVVIAHAADPRWWQCHSDEAQRCKSKLVADRVAWANGQAVEPTPQAFDYTTSETLTPNLTLRGVQAALGNGNELLSAVATTADGVRSVDPRWNMTGSRLLWIVRSVAATTDDTDISDPTLAVTVSLIDDATGQLVDSQPLALPADYNPARLWVTETRQNVDWNGEQSIGAFYRVEQSDKALVQDGAVGGGESGPNGMVVDGPDLPLLLVPGTYTLTAWLAYRNSPGESSPMPTAPIGECSTQETFNAGDDVLLNAVYQKHATCTWSNEERPSFGFL